MNELAKTDTVTDKYQYINIIMNKYKLYDSYF